MEQATDLLRACGSRSEGRPTRRGGYLLQVDGSRRSVLADGALENVFSIVLPLCTNRAMV